MKKKQFYENSTENGTLVNSVSKAFAILECFTPVQHELTLSQISKQLGFPKSTTLNLIRTLEANGYLLHTANMQTYQLGYNVLTLSYTLRSSLPIIQYAMPYLEELQIKTDENIYLTSHVNGQVIYLEGVYPSVRIGKYSIVGKRLPMHCTGCGKVMLAYLPKNELDAVVERWGLPSITSYTITTRERLDKELSTIRENGYSIDNEEESLGVRCVAVAIRDSSGYPCGAISISGATISMRDDVIEEYAKITARACNVLIANAYLLPASQLRQKHEEISE